MGKKNKILLILLGIILSIIVINNKWTFFYKFDANYWEHYYYTSQWNVPNSKVIISDEGVYRYVGYRLVNGENPFNVDYWVPPLGKYWYGVAAKYFGNPYWASWGWYFVLLVTVYLITKNIWVLILVATNPLIASQVGMTMLDLPQGALLMIHIGLLLMINKKKKWPAVAAGLALGLMMGVKIGFFVPLLALVAIFYLWKQTTSTKQIGLFLISIIAGYMLAYACYFLVHPNPIPWLKLHGKIIDFWKNSGAKPNPINIWTYIFLNKYNQVLDGARVWMSAREWTALFPVSLIIIFKLWLKKLDLKNKYFLLVASGWIIMCGMLDFWPRYFVPIVPVLTIICVLFFKKRKVWLIILLTTNLIGLWKLDNNQTNLANKTEGSVKEKYATIVNPIRSRELWKDKSLKAIEDQYQAIDNLGLKATWLIQNDVIEDKELVEKIKQFNDKQEIGIFLEISKNLALKSRVYFDEQRPWYDPRVVFLSAYDRRDRIKLINQIMGDFKNTFGYYPKSVGAWWIDSYSLNYLESKYKVKTALIVADQKTTDNYGVWGQWWGYPYYPAKDNILIPGNSKTLIIQWALRDPQLAYHGEGPKTSNYSLQANDYINQGLDIKYFEKLANVYFDPRNELGQITVGLETGIESVGYIDEYKKQLEWIKDNKINDLTMTEMGIKYREKYGKNPDEIKIEEWKMTPNFRENIKLGERIEYKKNYVFADYYEKDGNPFLNRVYEEKNLIKKSWISKEILLSLLAIIIGIIITKLWPKRKWIIILFFVWAGLLLATRLRYSVIDGEKLFGFLIDNFRFLGMTNRGRIINGDLSNLVAKSMLKLDIKEIYLTEWTIFGVIVTKVYEKFIKARKN